MMQAKKNGLLSVLIIIVFAMTKSCYCMYVCVYTQGYVTVILEYAFELFIKYVCVT